MVAFLKVNTSKYDNKDNFFTDVRVLLRGFLHYGLETTIIYFIDLGIIFF